MENQEFIMNSTIVFLGFFSSFLVLSSVFWCVKIPLKNPMCPSTNMVCIFILNMDVCIFCQNVPRQC